MNWTEELTACGVRVEAVLEHWLPPADLSPSRLHEAMRYAVLGGGKRIRPVLTYFTGRALGVDSGRLDGPAAAVELIHAYSLVHDDLPAMDDDDLRRGRPTCHRAFDEATAILAGDALQVLAFKILAEDPAMTPDSACRLEVIRLLAHASGTAGMAGGQAIDLEAAGQRLGVAALEQMHRLKTGALIHASVM
ncbi:MAG: polyprenyl synthetase family protein, partial [Gammaproteobacteria bacterium]